MGNLLHVLSIEETVTKNMTHLALENRRIIEREELSSLRIDFWFWLDMVAHRFFWIRHSLKYFVPWFPKWLKYPWNAYILLSTMVCLSYLEGWYWQLVSLTLALYHSALCPEMGRGLWGTWGWVAGLVHPSKLNFSQKMTSRSLLPKKYTVKFFSFLYHINIHNLHGLDIQKQLWSGLKL